MKSLIAICLMLVSSFAMSQAVRYAPAERMYWIEGQTLTITYSPLNAPSSIPGALAAEVLADIETKFNSLDLGGLTVRIGSREITGGCDTARARNTVHVCWENRPGTTADQTNHLRMEGTATFWREGTIMLNNGATWTRASLYSTLMHYMLHILGFGHPEGDSVQNAASDLTTLDINGLREMYNTNACAVTYNASTRTVDLPYVVYRNTAYAVQLQHNGGNDFTLVPNSIVQFNSSNLPTSRCQGLAVDANNDLRIDKVWVNGQLYWATLRFLNGRLTLTGRGQ